MAIVSPHMALAIWNLASDRYNHDQLADNWAKVDFHDHSPGRGLPIPTEGIADGAITAAKLAPGSNAVQDGSITPSKFATLPACKVYNSGVTSVVNGGETTLAFDSERFDTQNLHDTVTNTDRLTFQTAGIYMITLSTRTNLSYTTGAIGSLIYRNGVANELAASIQPPGAVSNTLTTFARMAVGDYVVARVLNTSGANINVVAGSSTAEGRNDFGAVWVAP